MHGNSCKAIGSVFRPVPKVIAKVATLNNVFVHFGKHSTIHADLGSANRNFKLYFAMLFFLFLSLIIYSFPDGLFT